ncbi:MAG TPA: hypothetical protein VM261_00385 [Kofleriaceae bacterium]|nr:hypothetical protein [Kofleriaceae bacterium]
MSQFVENRVGDFLGEGAAIPESGTVVERPVAPRPAPVAPRPTPSISPSLPPKSTQSASPFGGGSSSATPVAPRLSSSSSSGPVPMTSAAARYAIDPPPPIIKKAEQPAPKAPTMPKANEIFTF